MVRWLTLWAGAGRDPSLRLKNGYVQDDIAQKRMALTGNEQLLLNVYIA